MTEEQINEAFCKASPAWQRKFCVGILRELDPDERVQAVSDLASAISGYTGAPEKAKEPKPKNHSLWWIIPLSVWVGATFLIGLHAELSFWRSLWGN